MPCNLCELALTLHLPHSTIIRPANLVAGGIMLSPIRIGPHSTICQSSIVAPGASLPAQTLVGACSSSYEAVMDVAPGIARQSLR
jgi:hypothetical protein